VHELTEDSESILRVEWDIPGKPYPAKVVTLASGEKLVIREASREEVPLLLDAIRPVIPVEKDFYDLVGSRLYAELLGWYRYRVKNHFALVGILNGELVGIVNNRARNLKEHISLHTMAFRRGGRIGAHLFAAKHEHSIEVLGADKIFVTVEGPIGLRRWIYEWALEPWPLEHEANGGARNWVLTKEHYSEVKPRLVFGERPVPEDLLKSTLKPKVIVPDVVKQK